MISRWCVLRGCAGRAPKTNQRDGVERSIEASVAAAVEPVAVTCRPGQRTRLRSGSGQGGVVAAGAPSPAKVNTLALTSASIRPWVRAAVRSYTAPGRAGGAKDRASLAFRDDLRVDPVALVFQSGTAFWSATRSMASRTYCQGVVTLTAKPQPRRRMGHRYGDGPRRVGPAGRRRGITTGPGGGCVRRE